MARSQRKSGGPTRGRFKPKKMGKGWLTVRKQPQGSRPVLRITEPLAAEGETKTEDSSSASKE